MLGIMSGLKTLFAAFISVASSVTPLRAGEDIVWTFASCTGRLSAQMEHQWLVSDPASETTKARRAAMISLLEAVMTPDQGHTVLARRIEAKHAHLQLLTRAYFNLDIDDAAWAQKRAESEIAACASLMLG